MRTWRSSFGVLLWTQALYLGMLLALAGLAVVTGTATARTTPATAPAADPILVAVAGTVVGTSDELVGVLEYGGDQPVAFPVGAEAAISRGGDVAAIGDLRPEDPVWLTIDGRTGRVLRLDAEPATAPGSRPSDSLALVAALGLIVAGAALVARRRTQAWAAGGDRGSGWLLPAQVGRLGLVRAGIADYAPARRPASRV